MLINYPNFDIFNFAVLKPFIMEIGEIYPQVFVTYVFSVVLLSILRRGHVKILKRHSHSTGMVDFFITLPYSIV